MKQALPIPALDVSDDPGQPQYRRIADALCQAILSGEIEPGQRLPTRQAMAQALGTSPVTVGRGYEWLQGRGLVEQKRRSGTRVKPDALDILTASSSSARTIHGGSNSLFSEIVVVIGEADITCVNRDQLEILSQMLVGLQDVLGDQAGRIRHVPFLDRESLGTLADDAAVLVWGKQPAGAYESPAVLSLLHELGERDIPVIGMWSFEGMTGLPQVQYNIYQAVKIACEHLLDCGYRRLGYIGGMGEELAPKFYEFTHVLFKAGLDFQFAHVREADLKPGHAYQAALELAEQDLPDAFFVDVDWKAMEVVAAFEHKGISVPRDVAIIGFGDVADLRHFKPRMTTVYLPRREIGQEVGRQLLAWARDRTPLRSVLVDARLVARDTTMKIDPQAASARVAANQTAATPS